MLATHYWAVGPAWALDEYLRERAADYLFIAHPLFPGDQPVYIRRYRRGSMLGEVRHRSAARGVRFLSDVLRTVRWAGPGDSRRWFIAGDNLLALAGLWLRRRGRVSPVVLYSIDFVPRRFANPVLNWIYHRIDRFASSQVDAVWNAAAGIEQARRERDGHRPTAPQLVVPVGASFKRIKRYPLGRGRYQLAFLGHLLERQGVQLVIEAMPAIRAAFPESSLLVIGDGPYRPELEAIARRCQVEGAVEFAGYSNDHLMIEDRLAHSAIGVAPYRPDPESLSQFTDLPGKIKNYLACGLAVILTDVPQLAHTVEEAGAGKVVPYDRERLAAAVIDYLAHPDRLEEARLAAARMGERFDWDTVFNEAFERTRSLLR